jgi:hypothetical protein
MGQRAPGGGGGGASYSSSETLCRLTRASGVARAHRNLHHVVPPPLNLQAPLHLVGSKVNRTRGRTEGHTVASRSLTLGQPGASRKEPPV